jgi:hypothetical protein
MASIVEENSQPITKLTGVANFEVCKEQCESRLKLSGLWMLVQGNEVEPTKDITEEAEGSEEAEEDEQAEHAKPAEQSEENYAFIAERERFRSRDKQARNVIFDSCEPSVQELLWDFLSAQECWELLIDSYECPLSKSDRVDKWYKALDAVDCKELLKLLKCDESLVDVGWESEPSRSLETGEQEEWRTALHAGAIAGCVELIKLVFKLYETAPLSNPGETQQVAPTTAPNGIGGATSRPSQNERLTSSKSLGKPKGKLQTTDSRAAMTSYTNGTDDTTPVPNQIERSRRKSLHDLLKIKDSHLKLRAIAMAIQQGNRQLAPALLNATDRIFEHSLGLFFDPEKVREQARKESLRVVIKDFLREQERLERLRVRIEYAENTEFNCLPIEEYLFHFLCQRAAWIDLKLCRALWKRIRESGGDLWRLVLEYQDGRGRPPFHCAIDACCIDVF